MAEKVQHCDYCGEDLGSFEWSRTWDGPLACGKAECQREAGRDYREGEQAAAERAAEDGYSLYGGRGGW